ncbi:hypothetical protein KDJ57_gp14 [Gordonia phage Catfish]|uniref:Uncharacterized protein n=1 Tax=Gordonia phage Catfish TaxID=2301538 RepID=A0A385D1P9_9CAUD|nr:hypothetical protein KDJ57_gp14 [Gordonia phage Catfish]AXQ51851.1 hypothetical protein SEA_CATFISH_14 [Gordonia phage Catfish]
MPKYRVAFAAKKGQNIGDVVELSEDDAQGLVRYGRLVRIEDEDAAKVEPARAGRNRRAAKAQAAQDGADGDDTGAGAGD